MRLPFLNRHNELSRLEQAIACTDGSFCCLYGRRRCGKSRLLRQILPADGSVFYVADRREPGLQRTALAEAIASVIPGFSDATYPDWAGLLSRWWKDAPPGGVLALDEFPYLVENSPELPSLLQKLIDAHAAEPTHLVLCGSSQRMMQGLVLDESEPLYGRAREILHIRPLGAAWLPEAFGTDNWMDATAMYAAWGGVPRYWELAAEFDALWDAVESLILDPLGVLHQEPGRLLADDMRDTVQASSIMSVVGQGCRRLSEIAGRLGKPATSMTRPVQRLLQLGLLRRDVPFGQNPRSSKVTLYAIDDPFLAFWFRFVEPNRSRLGAGALSAVRHDVEQAFPHHEGVVWEQTVRAAIPRINVHDTAWGTASRWWGAGTDHRTMEIDVMAESVDGRSLLVGEAKLRVSHADVPRLERELREKVQRLPFADNYATITLQVFAAGCDVNKPNEHVLTAADVLSALT